MAKKQTQPKADTLPLVAVDIGSDGIRAMAARRIDQDLFEVLGVETSRRNRCVEQGIITQSSDAGFMIREALRLLANRIHIDELPTAFVSVGGRSMQIAGVKAQRDQVRKKLISKDLLHGMERECVEKIEERNPEVAVLGIVPSYFVLDGEEQEDVPSEQQSAALVEGHYIAFCGRKELNERLRKSFQQAGKSIERQFVRPDALLAAFACVDGEGVLQDGCAVLDLGAQTTTLTIYKSGQYLYNKVVGKGGYHITRLIEQQGVPYATAELLKVRYGVASPEQVEKNQRLSLQGGDIVVSTSELAECIASKLEEILSPLLADLAQYEGRLRTLYITGGGSMLHGIDDYLQRRTSLRVVYGGHDTLLTASTPEEYLTPTYSALVGTLLLGQDYREANKDLVVKEPSPLDKLKGTILDIFTDKSN